MKHQPYELAKIHPDALSASFQHRKELSDKFRDVLGLMYLDYISIEIINPDEEFIFLSAFPAVNFNLISNHFWPYDGAISPSFYKHQTFIQWEEAYHPVFYHELKKTKESEFGFCCGFSLVRKINQFYLLYSFATKNSDKEIKNFFHEKINDVLKIGDYCYKLIRPIYLNYSPVYRPPIITQFYPFVSGVPKESVNFSSHLKLVVNNV
ncbi:MAG: hypothetical protein HY939_07735 [Gammaproteobacteria bacterium]|nr:hypothetical protein [Gammaproteobacteria bacterium]